EGPHKDTQPLNMGAFHWFERWLKKADPMAVLDEGAKKWLEPEQLRVFSELPKDERNTHINEEFVPVAPAPSMADDSAAWSKQRDQWIASLREKCFAAWPKAPCDLALRPVGTAKYEDVVLQAWDFTPQPPWTLRLYVAHHTGLTPEELELIALNVLDEHAWHDFRNMMAGHFGPLFSPAERAGADGHGFADEQKMF